MIDYKELKKFTKEMSVLYVEDDKNIRRSLGEFLNKFFAFVALAEDGQEGLELYKKGNFDIVISDINMPKMNGIEMSKNIFKELPSQSIIIISAHNEPDYLLELINSGITHYALKPVNIKQLSEVIYEIVVSKHNDKAADIHQKSIHKKI